MMKKITLLLAILLVNLGFAQTLPFDFSDPIHAMTGADGAVVTVVQDNGNDVLQIVGNGGDWDNAQINFAENLDLSDDANNTISFRIKAVNGTGSGNHALKFENGTTGDTELTFSISGTEWTDISLDFQLVLVVMVEWLFSPILVEMEEDCLTLIMLMISLVLFTVHLYYLICLLTSVVLNN